jgi:hypothetical protein
MCPRSPLFFVIFCDTDNLHTIDFTFKHIQLLNQFFAFKVNIFCLRIAFALAQSFFYTFVVKQPNSRIFCKNKIFDFALKGIFIT